jgi:hypothetical protein
MNRSIPRALPLPVLGLLAGLALLVGAPAGRPADKAGRDGWVNLLAGGDLGKHWTTKGNWMLDKGGVLHLEPRPGEKGWERFDDYLWTKRQYADFEAEFDYKVAKHGNSGFYVRVGDKKSPVVTGIEVQIYDSAGKPPGAKLSDHDSGGIIPGVPPIRNAAKPAGEWNHMHIGCKGSRLTVLLNAVLVNDVDLGRGQLKSRPPTGYVGLQDHGMPLWFRNLRIKEVK